MFFNIEPQKQFLVNREPRTFKFKIQ
jgi:hypothetical protein